MILSCCHKGKPHGTTPIPNVQFFGIAGGFYSDENLIQFPMLAVSSNSGETWDYKIQSGYELPRPFVTDGSFNSVNCSGLICIAGGNYHDGLIDPPMLAVSSDGGQSWSYKIDATPASLPPSLSSGIFNSVNCAGLTCIAGGNFSGNNPTKFPMLSVSSDGGQSWSYKIDATLTSLPPSFFNAGVFKSVNCSGLTCIAGGQYDTNNALPPQQYPMLAVSIDGGLNWSYKIDATPSSLPQSYNNTGFFQSVNCSGLTCIAGGSYKDGSTQYPMLAVSSNGGLNWSYKIDAATPTSLPTSFNNTGVFNSVNCSSLICIAGGSYNNGSKVYPMLAVSIDGGLNWTYKLDATTVLPKSYDNNGSFESVNCADLVCTVGGFYKIDGAKQFPMLAVSSDGGETWTYKIDATQKSLPQSFSDAGFSKFNSVNTFTGLN